jgi:Protein of unknown function (DUF2490)
MKKIIILFGLIPLLSAAIFSQAPTDKQIWTSADFVIALKKGNDENGKEVDKISLVLSGVARFGSNVSRSVDERFGAALDFRVNKFLNVSGGYLHQRYKPFITSRSEESRIFVAGILNKRTKNFNFRFREQYDHKFRNNRVNTQNIRTFGQINYYLKHNKKDLFSPFLSYENYYDTLTKSKSRTEFRSGITRNFSKKVSADFFYIRLGTPVVNANGFGIGLKFKIR